MNFWDRRWIPLGSVRSDTSMTPGACSSFRGDALRVDDCHRNEEEKWPDDARLGQTWTDLEW